MNFWGCLLKVSKNHLIVIIIIVKIKKIIFKNQLFMIFLEENYKVKSIVKNANINRLFMNGFTIWV